MSDKNKDFLPPEMIETMRSSVNITVQQLFRNKLTKTGNLTVSSNQPKVTLIKSKSEKEIENLKTRVSGFNIQTSIKVFESKKKITVFVYSYWNKCGMYTIPKVLLTDCFSVIITKADLQAYGNSFQLNNYTYYQKVIFSF